MCIKLYSRVFITPTNYLFNRYIPREEFGGDAWGGGGGRRRGGDACGEGEELESSSTEGS